MKKNKYLKIDKTYLNKKIVKKEYFKKIINYLQNKYKNNVSLIDVGCASGDFLYSLTKKNFDLTGIDFSKASIKTAKKKVNSATFKIQDLNKEIKLKEKYDICTCLGTLSIFDNSFKIINNLIKIVKKNGELIFFDLINENDVNVLMRYQKNFENNSEWLSGFNCFSKKYWNDKLKNNSKIKSFTLEKFNIKKKLTYNKNNPMRAWTINFKKKNQIVVGTGQLLNFYIIKIKLN
jgi:2-polyprenyl-3-methyl-5-hydroxy-6-metoxy-1,4-benzoquinol methylase